MIGAPPGARIEIHGGPDSLGRYRFTMLWPCSYFPGHPDGEHVERERGQCYFGPLPPGIPPERVSRLD